MGVNILRWTLPIALLVFVARETGWATTIVCGLLILRCELEDGEK